MNIIKEIDDFGGEYYIAESEDISDKFEVETENPGEIKGFLCSYRKEPFFMDATAGNSVNDIPKETQWLAIKNSDDSYSVYFSICDKFRTALYGKENSICVSDSA